MNNVFSVQNSKKPKQKKGLCIAHLNIATLPGHYDEFKFLMHGNSYDIMGLSETRLDYYIPDKNVSIPNYTLYRNDRKRDGGGVAVFVKQTPSYTHILRNDLMPNELEIIVLEIKPSNSKSFFVIMWYRPPDTKMELFDHIEKVMQNVELEGKDIIMIGAMNCDVIAPNPCCYTKRLSNIETGYHLHQVITEPTRITENTSTLIDHIYVPDVNKVVDSGVIHIGISDHSLVFVNTSIGTHTKVNKTGHKYQYNRNNKHFNVTDFVTDLNNVNWTPVTHCNDVNVAVNYLSITLCKCL